ncbi:1286_t:CDS:2, partial [Entrophospora sp. SA101]
MQQPLFKSAFNKSKVIPFEKQTENQNLFKTQDLEILSSIVTFATFISCSSKITTTSYINIFRAHDIVLRKRNINPKSNKLYYQSLLKLSMEPGESWFQKFENIVKNLGYMTDSNIYKWILSVTSTDLQSRNTYYNDCDDDDKLLKTNTSDIEFGLKSKNESLTTSTDQLDVILNDSMSYQSNNLDDDCIDFKQSDKIILSKFSPKEKVKLKNILRNWKSLNSVPKRYAYFDDDINKTLTQKAFEKWKERYKNYILLSEVADLIKVKFLQWREALQRRKIMSKTASVPLLNRCLLEWYSRTIQKYKQKEHERKLALEVLR